MCGGSYEYLCYKDPDDLIHRIDLIDNMKNRLIELGYLDAAKETESIKLIINQFTVNMGARLDRLSEIWRAVEWMDSGDSGIERVEEEIKKYRG